MPAASATSAAAAAATAIATAIAIATASTAGAAAPAAMQPRRIAAAAIAVRDPKIPHAVRVQTRAPGPAVMLAFHRWELLSAQASPSGGGGDSTTAT